MPITIELSDIQQSLMTDVLVLENERRAAQIPPLPAWMLNDWVADKLQKAISRGIAEAEALDFNRIAVAYQQASPSARAQVKANLGLTDSITSAPK